MGLIPLRLRQVDYFVNRYPAVFRRGVSFIYQLRIADSRKFILRFSTIDKGTLISYLCFLLHCSEKIIIYKSNWIRGTVNNKASNQFIIKNVCDNHLIINKRKEALAKIHKKRNQFRTTWKSWIDGLLTSLTKKKD